jgi:hypothetical protein
MRETMMASKSTNGKKDVKQPNVLVIWGDDIGITNLSAYSDGIMGGIGRPASIASRMKVCGSPILMGSRAAQQVEPHLLPDRAVFEPG